MLGLLPLMLLSLIGEELFSVIFGNQWSEAGIYSQILSIWCFSAFLVQPLTHIINVFEKQKQGLIINIIRLAIRIGTLIYCVSIKMNIIETIIYFSLASAFSNILFLFYLLNISGNTLKEFSLPSLRYLFYAVIFCSPLFIMQQFYNFTEFVLILLSIFLFISYGTFILIIDNGFRKLVYKAILR